jgi:hemerythrin superfamily protein
MTLSEMPNSIGRHLLADHQRLDALFDRLLNVVHAGDWAASHATWSRFEQDLLNHIDAEEVFLLPTFERVDPRETAGLRQEHATIRYLLADMGVRLELHAVKEENVQRLVDSLRAHAAREEALLYGWAKDLAPDLAHALLERLSSGDKSTARAAQSPVR